MAMVLSLWRSKMPINMTICENCKKLIHSAPGYCTLCGSDFIPCRQVALVKSVGAMVIWCDAADVTPHPARVIAA